MSTGHAPRARFEVGLLDEPVRRCFAHAIRDGTEFVAGVRFAMVFHAAGEDTTRLPCGCEVRSERRFGHVVVPCALTVGWWFGTPRYTSFFEADLLELASAGGTT